MMDANFLPSVMKIGVTIDNVWVDNIMLPYIPITSKGEVIEAIKKTLALGESVEEKSIL